MLSPKESREIADDVDPREERSGGSTDGNRFCKRVEFEDNGVEA